MPYNRRTHLRTPLLGGDHDSAAYMSSHRILIARAGDVSATGAFLRTREPDPVGTRGTLAVRGEELDVEVVRVCFDGLRGTGMGVAFVDVPRDIRRRLMGGFGDTEPMHPAETETAPAAE